MESEEDKKWNPKNTMIVAQKKQNKNIGTTNPEGLNSRSSHNRMHRQKTTSTTQDKG